MNKPRLIIDWRPITTRGTQAVVIPGGKVIRVPATAKVKIKPPFAYILTGGVVSVVSHLGEAVLARGLARDLASNWRKI